MTRPRTGWVIPSAHVSGHNTGTFLWRLGGGRSKGTGQLGEDLMTRVLFVLGLVVWAAVPAFARQAPDSHQHHEPAMALALAADQRGGGAPQAAPVEVPWNDAIAPGTAEHAARALKESPRHGETGVVGSTAGPKSGCEKTRAQSLRRRRSASSAFRSRGR